MCISGLLITLSSDEGLSSAAMRAIETHDCLECEQPADRWLPAVLETRDEAERRSVFGWLEALPGVEYVDVIFVSLEDQTAAIPS